ncbi:MAG TPA: GGDEF domain-containing protein [Alphaproteobacteria bacterium]|nr:GGDEF domain-containing protein [Alphaproteobacteria bacterium]
MTAAPETQTHNDDSINAEKVSRAYMLLAILLFTAITGAGFLQHHIGNKQTALMQVAMLSEQQVRLTQLMGIIVAQNQETPDPKNIERLRAAANAALEAEPRMLLNMHIATWSPMPQLNLEALQPVRQLTDKVFSYAAHSENNNKGFARDYAQEIMQLSRSNVAAAWHQEATAFIDARVKETQKVIYFSYALYAAMLALLAWQAVGLVMPALNVILRQRDFLKNLAAADALTGLYNRGMLFRVASMLISSARRHKQELAVLSVDVDGCQKINDKHGRAGGDLAIRVIAETIAEQLRTSDVIGRVGGNEFALFLPSTDEYRAGVVAEKIRTAVESIPFSIGDSNIVLTISIGVADIQPHHKTPDDMLRAAEYALRLAKKAGRNRAMTYSAAHLEAAEAVGGGATGGDAVGE